MFGVLIVVLGSDDIAGLGFSLGQRQIPLVASLRILRALRPFARAIRFPPLRSGLHLMPISVGVNSCLSFGHFAWLLLGTVV